MHIPPQLVEPGYGAQQQVAELEPIVADEMHIPADDLVVGQEVEIPFEVDQAVQIMADFQMAQDVEMAELLVFEMGYDVLPTKPRSTRNRRSPELFRYIEFVCVRCGKKIVARICLLRLQTVSFALKIVKYVKHTVS